MTVATLFNSEQERTITVHIFRSSSGLISLEIVSYKDEQIVGIDLDGSWKSGTTRQFTFQMDARDVVRFSGSDVETESPDNLQPSRKIRR